MLFISKCKHKMFSTRVTVRLYAFEWSDETVKISINLSSERDEFPKQKILIEGRLLSQQKAKLKNEKLLSENFNHKN